jgi:hypothetical protein
MNHLSPLDTEVVGLNPTQGMDVCIVCVYSVFFCVGSGLRLADPRPKGPTDCVQDQEAEKAAKTQQRPVEP